jgi:hypothetical protein
MYNHDGERLLCPVCFDDLYWDWRKFFDGEVAVVDEEEV